MSKEFLRILGKLSPEEYDIIREENYRRLRNTLLRVTENLYACIEVLDTCNLTDTGRAQVEAAHAVLRSFGSTVEPIAWPAATQTDRVSLLTLRADQLQKRLDEVELRFAQASTKLSSAGSAVTYLKTILEHVIERGRLVQIGAGGMSQSDYIDWVLKQLGG